MYRFIAIALLAFLLGHQASAKTLALTFDDGLNPETQASAETWNASILATLRAHNIKAMFFPSLRFVGSGAGRGLVQHWAAEGHPVGNHTSEHRSLNSPKVSAAQFIGHVREAQAAFEQLPTWRPMLRFPYLKEGDTAEKRDAVRGWMRENGYRHAPVSIDASDWYYSSALAKIDSESMLSVRQLYLDHLLARADHYNALAQEVLGREPHHVLLLHTNQINAQWLGDVIRHFRQAGWRFVHPAEAFEDPLYALSPASLPAGESIVWALAKDAGIQGLRYPAEDAAYELPLIRHLLRGD
jgi:peptidoglycan/xylan/chitin deacetylase (PgdA/CDA1 family)